MNVLKVRLITAMAILIVGGGALADHASATHLGHPHLVDPQTYTMDANVCFDATTGMTGNEDPSVVGALACGAETLTPGAAVDVESSILLPAGRRLTTNTTYFQSGFAVLPDASIADGTAVGGAKGQINILCDDNVDFAADAASTADKDWADLVLEPMLERTTAWGPGTGVEATDESYLTRILPALTNVVRYRGDFDYTIFAGMDHPLPSISAYNVVTQQAPWSLAAVVTRHYYYDARPPDDFVEYHCYDAPLTISESYGAGTGFALPVTPGVYAVWTTALSTPGMQDEQVQTFTYVTHCKTISTTAIADLDNDCLADASEAAPADSDQDNDGLIDGVDLAWGGMSCVTDADCDDDGRTDLEEMVGPGPFLTNPTASDTDGDLLLDAGYMLDCDGDGEPDDALEAQNAGSGRNRSTFAVQYCKPDGSSTNNSTTCPPATSGECGGHPFGNVGAASVDNCPGVSNGGQENTANADLPNGRFNGANDVTQADGRFAGDACDPDADSDRLDDKVELAGFWYDATGGGSGSFYCNDDGVGVAVLTSATNRDSDGDGTMDGNECMLRTNPADPLSKPGSSLTTGQEIVMRHRNLSLPGGGYQDGLLDGEVVSAISQTRLGLMPNVRDTDRDGCADAAELSDVDGDRTVGAADRLAVARAVLGISPFIHPLTAEEVRTADVDGNGVVQGAGGTADRLTVARVSLSTSLAAILDYQTNCTAAALGYEAN